MAARDFTTKSAISDDQFEGPLVLIKKELNELVNLKNFFFTLESLSEGKEDMGEQLVTELPISMLYDLGIKIDCLVNSIFYKLHPRYEKDRQEPQAAGSVKVDEIDKDLLAMVKSEIKKAHQEHFGGEAPEGGAE
ncbi:MAG: hypothetical protein NTY36_01960 [Deltaproteobacteria bacterium]|nr:hypothetical protein [Deltaproteobacteria bacterium]